MIEDYQYGARVMETSAFPGEDEVLLILFELFNKNTKRGRGWLHNYTISFCGWSNFDGRGREEGWRQYLNIDIAQDLADASDEIEDEESADETDSLESGLMKRKKSETLSKLNYHAHVQMLAIHIPFNLMFFEYCVYSLKPCKSAPRSV